MNLRLFLLFLLGPLLAVPGGANPDVSSPLTSRYRAEALAGHLLPADAWRWFPPASDRASWEAWLAAPVNQARRDFLVQRAEALLGQPWPDLPATLYMEFVRTGNRSRFEDRYFDRRERLGLLVLAECENQRADFIGSERDTRRPIFFLVFSRNLRTSAFFRPQRLAPT